MKKPYQNYRDEGAPRYVKLSKASSPQTIPETITVVSYNIRHARKISEAILTFRNHSIINDADIIFLQEMDYQGVDQLAEALSYNYVYYPSTTHPMTQRDFGNAILSKWPISDDRKIVLEGHLIKIFQRIAVGATIQIANHAIRIYSVHMGVFLGTSGRKQQIKNLLKTIPSSIDRIIIGGDFNTYSSKTLKYIPSVFADKNFDWVTKSIGWTYIQKNFFSKKFTLDHLFTKNFQVIDAGKITDTAPSDHLPIWAKFKLNT